MTLLDRRPRVGNLVVPFIVDESRDPIDFKIIDPKRVEACAVDGRCGVCGGKIKRGPVAFLGPGDDFRPLAGPAVIERDCFADPWMHPECAELTQRSCPFVAGRRGYREQASPEEWAGKVYEYNMVLRLAYNWRSHKDAAGRWHFQAVR